MIEAAFKRTLAVVTGVLVLATATQQAGAQKKERGTAQEAAASAVPIPRPRSVLPGETRERAAAAEAEKPAAPPACLASLSTVAIVREGPAAQGRCAAADVVELIAVIAGGERVAIAPPAMLRCAMAEAVVAWLTNDVAQTVRALGTHLRGVAADASFECRGRNRIEGAKLSEHGKANALDIRAFALSNGKRFELTDLAADKATREALRQSACARFTTVLGPGSDGFHEDHVHVDLAERRSGYRLCQWDVRDAADVPVPRERPAAAPPRISSR